MPLKTTVVGAYPKPAYLKTPDWFKDAKVSGGGFVAAFSQYVDGTNKGDLEALQRKAAKEVIQVQEDIGIDIVTDGEVLRENYIYHFCRQLKGIDFNKLTLKEYRNGACSDHVPTISGPVAPLVQDGWCAEEWKRSSQLAETSAVKMTLPGPTTIIDSMYNAAYSSEEDLSLALVECINKEVRALAESGCRYIQIDEPVFARKPEVALKYGILHLSQCFKGVGAEVQKIVHVCCGYPQYLDQEDYMKADKNAYLQIAEQLDNAGLDAISLEDTHTRNVLDLFDQFKKTKIILGVVAIAKSRVETVEEVTAHVEEVMQRIPASRLILAPDCGLGYLPQDIIKQKLQNMVTVAKSIN